MTKISNTAIYVYDTNISDNDYVIGSDADTTKKQTKNYRVVDFRNYLLAGLSPETGGTQKISEVIYNGELYTTPSQVANALNPAVQIQRYEDCIFTINGNRYQLKLQDVSIGVFQTPINDSDFIVLSKTTSVGNGIPVFNGYNNTTRTHEFGALSSNSIRVFKEVVDGQETGGVQIELVETTDIPRFIVNSAYTGEEETGSLSKPFKDIQDALEAFQGTGTPIAPQFSGAEIVIQKGNGYNFTGNVNYNGITWIQEEGTIVTSNPSSGTSFCDFDILPNSIAKARFIFKEGSLLELVKSGFKNNGTTTATNNFIISKSIEISGTGTIIQNSLSNTNEFKIFESNFSTGNTFNNDGGAQILVNDVSLTTNTQSIYSIGGNSRIIFKDVVVNLIGSTTLPTSTTFFNQIGGTVRINSSEISVVAVNPVTIETLFPISKSNGIPSILNISNLRLEGKMNTVFENTSINQPNVQAIAIYTEFFVCTNIAKSENVMWTGCALYNNTFLTGKPDLTQVDLTSNNFISSYNIFEGNVHESLRQFNNRASAVSAGLIKGEKFINTNGISSPTTGWTIDMVM